MVIEQQLCQGAKNHASAHVSGDRADEEHVCYAQLRAERDGHERGAYAVFDEVRNTDLSLVECIEVGGLVKTLSILEHKGDEMEKNDENARVDQSRPLENDLLDDVLRTVGV